ncbi:internal scaffolding protein [Sigmofec virus UA08Rod_5336]|uniref:Internal scaffolding protein n=1 Tax=Sigmofec virus UA08Rod_5336 TaxID=2929419 RepID=A0A976N1D7_9VIRU|nr:internal scaffolding protein [Sigmofec virus UA08Rod_5336]
MITEQILKKHNSNAQTFPEEVIVKRAGSDWNITKSTEEMKDETDIIKVMKKYGCIDSLIIDEAKVFDDVTEIQKMSKEDYYKKNTEAKELWLNLPAELKARYNNDIETFITNAPTDLKKYADERNELIRQENERMERLKTNTEKVLEKAAKEA